MLESAKLVVSAAVSGMQSPMVLHASCLERGQLASRQRKGRAQKLSPASLELALLREVNEFKKLRPGPLLFLMRSDLHRNQHGP
jgi:hypothetical protein